MNKKNILILSLFFITLIANASRLKRGFQSLDIYNYFEAKNLFEKTKKRHVVAASYGLSVIYQRDDNPFYNLDSAYNHIILAADNFSQLKEKKRIRYKKYGVDSVRIIRQRDLVSNDLFDRALDVNSIYGFQDFIDKNTWSPNIERAELLRDSLYFFEMHEKGNSESYSLFLNTYPNSIYVSQAKNLFDKNFYTEKTKNDFLISYVDFLNIAPSSPFVPDAEDRIFELSTKTKTTKAYENFIKDYPNNRNVNLAWKMLYETNLQKNYSRIEIESFLDTYPEYPFKSGAEEELKMEAVDFLSIRISDKWGFISEDNSFYIAPKYDYVEDFSEGLAIVSIDSKVGFISKTGEKKIDLKFDDAYSFQNGYAVVEVDEKFGLINRSGEYVVEPKYEDLGNIVGGFCFFEMEESGYGYFDRKGIIRLKPDYSDASNFENGIAIVSKNESYGVIDEFGTTYIPLMYDEINKLDSSHFAVRVDDNWGVLNLQKDTILPFIYSYVGNVNSNIFMVEKDFKFNFWNRESNKIVSEVWFENYPEYKELGKFNDGYAKIKTDDGYNFIDYEGKPLFTKSYSNLGEYNKNIAFEIDGKWGFINTLGLVTVQPIYDKTQSFSNGGGIVELLPLKGVVNQNGNLLLEVFYEDFTFLSDSVCIVKSRGRYGLISTKKDTIISIEYKFIEPYSNSVVKIVNENEQWYYNFVTDKWIKREE